MSLSQLSRQIRSLLDDPTPDKPSLPDVLNSIDDFVISCTSSSEPEIGIYNLSNELQIICEKLLDHSSLFTISNFLAVLYRLEPLLSPTSIISVWFDLVLRPSLREPRLPGTALKQAKNLVLSALDTNDHLSPEKVADFRRRLVDYYLLDVFNDGSGEDMLEWAELSDGQREVRVRWKGNLEDVLVSFGKRRPEDLMTEINTHFATPSSRLQLIRFIDVFITSHSSPPSSLATLIPILASHPLLQTILTSLLLDGSTTTCTVALSLLIKLVPLFAVHAREELLKNLPYIFVVLQRILCWKQPPLASHHHYSHSHSGDDDDITLSQTIDAELNPVLALRPDLGWDRLKNTFAGASSVPEVRGLFTLMYYLFPCALVLFLRAPLVFISEQTVLGLGLDCPYVGGWEAAIDEEEVRSKAEQLIRTHTCHASLISSTAVAELAGETFWRGYGVERIWAESRMVDVRRMGVAVRGRYAGEERGVGEGGLSAPGPAPVVDALTSIDVDASTSPGAEPSPSSTPDTSTPDASPPSNPSLPSHPTTTLDHADILPGRVRISLEKILAVSTALRSNIELEIVEPTSQWASVLLGSSTSSSPPSEDPDQAQAQGEDQGQLPSRTQSQSDDPIPPHVLDMLALLMREVLLLRNELNFELWVGRESSKHIGRLYEDRLVSKRAEMERQGLYNKLRRYRADVVNLERALSDQKAKFASSKSKYEDWTTELHDKLMRLRLEKDVWLKESATLRTQATESRAMLEAQKGLLANASRELFEVKTKGREVGHKVERLRDYEKVIEGHVRVQSLWDEDFAKFNERAEEMEELKGQLKQMFYRLQSYEATSKELDEQGRRYRRQIQSLEARLDQQQQQQQSPSAHHMPDEFALLVTQKAELTDMNRKLREKHGDMVEEVEELRAMVEVLRGGMAPGGGHGLMSGGGVDERGI